MVEPAASALTRAEAQGWRVGVAGRGPADADTARELLILARHAEALGLDSFWLPEGHFRRGATPSPLLVLAALAARTRRVRLGTTSLLISIRDPLRVATEVATLQLLSGARLVLGLGRGFERALFRGFGLDPGSKRDRFDQALDVMEAAWAGAPGPQGTLLSALRIPPPPLWVAAFGRKGLIQAAARGLPYLASPLETLERLRENYALHRAHLRPGAGPGARAVGVIRTLHVARDAAEAERVRATVREELEGIASLASPALARAAAGAPEARAIVGEVSQVVEALGTYRETLGTELLVVRPAPRTTLPEQQASLERLAERVLPELA